MELILFFSALLFIPITGGIYSTIGEGKKRELRLKSSDECRGFGIWYAKSLTSWKHLFLYFWIIFEIPYPLTLLMTVAFIPSLAVVAINVAWIGFFISTIAALLISYNLVKLEKMLYSTETIQE